MEGRFEAEHCVEGHFVEGRFVGVLFIHTVLLKEVS